MNDSCHPPRTSSRLTAGLILAGQLAGCAAVQGYPERSNDVQADLSALRAYFQPAKIQAGGGSRSWRDEVVNSQIRAIDLQFTTFQQAIVKESVGLNTVIDLTVIGLGAATGVVAGETTKSVLGVLSGGLTGAKGVVDKDVFYSKTMPVLLAQMEAQRKVQLSKIRSGLLLDTRVYPLSAALVDLEEYYRAGSIPGALQGIIEESGAAGKQAEVEMKLMLVKASAADVLSITQVRHRLNALFAEWKTGPTTTIGVEASNSAKAILEALRPRHGLDGQAVFDALDAEVRKRGNSRGPGLSDLSAAFAGE